MMKIRWRTKEFKELSLQEFHDLMKLRVDVFVVEQTCPYAELDGKDPEAIHLFGLDNEDRMVAVARILPPDADDLPHLGRIAVDPDHRGNGLAKELMELALSTIAGRYGSRRSALAAQAHLEMFYASFGFERKGPDYPWDGVPHVDMVRSAE
jgi:ElaA protein